MRSPLLLGITLSVFTVLSSHAQPCNNCPPGNPPPPTPISGVEILLGLGGLYGAKRFYDLKRKR